MIKGIYWDIDETLIHTFLRKPNQNHLKIALSDGFYYTIIRPCAQRIIDFSRDLVGVENVFILTASTTDYCRAINEAAGWGFSNEQIFAREDQEKYSYRGAYGGTQYVDSPQAHLDNVLIDNLPPRSNESKIAFLGIWKTFHANYLQVGDYRGVDFLKDSFEEDVKEFLISCHSACNNTGEKKFWKFSLFEKFTTDLKRFGVKGDFIFLDEINGAKFFVGEIKDGILTILKGYEWDGNTPKFRLFGKILGIPDFPETWEASLVHDFLIEYCRQHNISRKIIDEIFQGILREKDFVFEPIYSNVVHLFRLFSRKLDGCK